METVCRACGYQRKATDQAPDWACPSCGKAYAKTSHDSPAVSMANAERSQAESGNRLSAGLSYRRLPIDADFGKAGGTHSNQEWRFRAVMGVLLVWSISILVSPSSAAVLLLHGEAELVIFTAAALTGVFLVIRPLSANVDMNDPWSRFAFAAKLAALIFSVMFIASAIPVGNTERTEVKIQGNGQRAMGDVVRFYAGHCGKRSNSCSIDVEYAFTPTSDTNGASQRIHGHGQLSASDSRYDPNVVYARTNKQVPIAYEVDRPELSALNFNDDVFRIDHVKAYRNGVARLGKFFLGIFMACVVIAGFTFWLNPGRRLNPD